MSGVLEAGGGVTEPRVPLGAPPGARTLAVLQVARGHYVRRSGWRGWIDFVLRRKPVRVEAWRDRA